MTNILVFFIVLVVSLFVTYKKTTTELNILRDRSVTKEVKSKELIKIGVMFILVFTVLLIIGLFISNLLVNAEHYYLAFKCGIPIWDWGK